MRIVPMVLLVESVKRFFYNKVVHKTAREQKEYGLKRDFEMRRELSLLLNRELINGNRKLKGFHFALTPIPLDSGGFAEPLCDFDLQEAIQKKEVRLKNRGGNFLFNKCEVLKSIERVLNSLDWLNSRGYIHGDVKPANILVYLNDDREIYSFIYGFEATYKGFNKLEGFMPPNERNRYHFWDPCLDLKGETNPYTDLYGVAITIFCAMFPHINPESVSKDRYYESCDQKKGTDEQEFDSMVNNLIRRQLLRSVGRRTRAQKMLFEERLQSEMSRLKWNTLTNGQKAAWSVLSDLIDASAQLYFWMKHSNSPLTKESKMEKYQLCETSSLIKKLYHVINPCKEEFNNSQEQQEVKRQKHAIEPMPHRGPGLG